MKYQAIRLALLSLFMVSGIAAAQMAPKEMTDRPPPPPPPPAVGQVPGVTLTDSRLGALLNAQTETIKALQAKVDELEARVRILEAKTPKVKKKIQ